MAVYKATYCYPLLNSLDIRIATDGLEEKPCEWLTCKIDSSNKKITGYKVRILDSANNQIFPSASSNNGKGYVSPISELPEDPSDIYANTGYNGTVLKIPFFQNYNYSATPDENEMELPSFNAVYYIPRYKVDYVLIPTSSNVLVVVDEDHIYLTGPSADYDRGQTQNDVFSVGNILLKSMDSSQCEKGIFQITKIEGSNNFEHKVYLERVNGVGTAELINHDIVVSKGVSHDQVYRYDSEGEYSVVEDHSGLWVDIEGHPIVFNIDGGSYKWEVTLYQGDAAEEDLSVTLTPGGATIEVSTADYTDISFDWYDTVLNSGKILGSTNKRIHIASALDDTGVLPIGDKNSPIVLQGTYAQLLFINSATGADNPQPIASRAYVQSYDSTFGHVYPINGGFSKEDIAAATNICFYKHSNNAEEVLAKERVRCATTENLALYVESGGEWHANPNLGLPVIDGIQTQEGDYILVKDQTRQYENGVYVAHATGTGWTRNGSYKTWGDFIGAILFVISGTVNGATNWESTAGAGGTLFNGGSVTGSLLSFIPEKPITLLPVPNTVDLVRDCTPLSEYNPSYGDVIIHSGNPWKVRIMIDDPRIHLNDPSRGRSDGVGYSGNQTILCTDERSIINIISVTLYTDMIITPPPAPQIITKRGLDIEYNVVEEFLDSGVYYNVNNGATYGDQVVKLTSEGVEIAHEAKSAYILKNTKTDTYVSPYTGLREDMALKLLNNKTVTYSDQTVSQWIRICSEDPAVKAVNDVTWRIHHKELLTPLESDSPIDSTIPFAYEVRTYYRASDENPFYTNEAPYLWVQVVTDPSVDNYLPLPTRYVTLEAHYCQFQQDSWESYRWMLLDRDNNIVQDTGLKYDHDMTVTFYGLSNEDRRTDYKAVLYVTDDKQNDLTAEREFRVTTGTVASTITLTAEFECSTHSIHLMFDEGGESMLGKTYSIYRREYQKYSAPGFDGSLIIKTVQGPWEPVALKTAASGVTSSMLNDFNIKSGHSYQYVIFPTGVPQEASIQQVFANAPGHVPYTDSSVPIEPKWDEWSLIELKPVKNSVDAPILRKTYEADVDNMWLFKYSLETGNQIQNFQKSEIQTLGQFQNIGYGRMNYISGDVSCLLGSEIVLYSPNGYIERMREGIIGPLSTNEKAHMLEQWRKIAFSPNPKLLKDIKGQSWIVQIMSSNNSPKNFYPNQPDTISFSWKQIDDTDGIIIIGGSGDLDFGNCNPIWQKIL